MNSSDGAAIHQCYNECGGCHCVDHARRRVATQVADAIAFPNGMVITPENQTLIVSESFTGMLLAFDIDGDGRSMNRRAWAEDLGPDGICLDADGVIWTSPAQPDVGVVRAREDGEVLDEIELDIACFVTGLGGPDGRTPFMMRNDFQGPDKFDEMIPSRTAKVLIADAPAPAAGWPKSTRDPDWWRTASPSGSAPRARGRAFEIWAFRSGRFGVHISCPLLFERSTMKRIALATIPIAALLFSACSPSDVVNSNASRSLVQSRWIRR